ncbi:PA0069 family radical SAM protein [Larkinella terrae]|uniref:PA0069 family radical SAM protein n=1 Tax=Larkinella terrae TaxID=2025311 RepID=A0A7K0ENL0_9BACT|nr:PA0069 family radical SAM protein [Larkinella terrae]MRS63076.1 PA0069 family radical SAM protein [Larkinella terrae]
MTNDYLKGRGAQFNVPNRFQALRIEPDSEQDVPDDDFPEPAVKTQFYEDNPKQIVSRPNSPDIGFVASVNPYMGCEHGCIYCYARNSHEYWGFSAGLDFESKIMVKKNAPALLEKEFLSKNYQPEVIHLSGNTDCYQPAERRFKLTRQLLERCLMYRNPVSILTKNALVLRDKDILQQLAAQNLVMVLISITTLDDRLRQAMEPRTVTAQRRLQVMAELTKAGIPVGVMTAPIIPGLNDQEIPKLIEAAGKHGARWAGYTIVRLNGAIEPLFEDWIRKNYPDRADKVLSQIRECHGGQLHDSRFGTRMSGEGRFAEQIRQLHHLALKKYIPDHALPKLDTSRFLRKRQFNLFD